MFNRYTNRGRNKNKRKPNQTIARVVSYSSLNKRELAKAYIIYVEERERRVVETHARLVMTSVVPEGANNTNISDTYTHKPAIANRV